MYKFSHVSAALALAIFFTNPIAAQAETAMGIIESIDVEDALITLDDSEVYMLPEDVDPNTLGIGLQVEIEFDEGDDGRFITSLSVIG